MPERVGPVVTVRLGEELVARVDGMRGTIPRAEFVRAAVRSAMNHPSAFGCRLVLPDGRLVERGDLRLPWRPVQGDQLHLRGVSGPVPVTMVELWQDDVIVTCSARDADLPALAEDGWVERDGTGW